MMKKTKWIGILSGVCAFSLYAGAHVSVQANAESSAELWKGFSITATAVRTADPAGLRFKTDVERLTPLVQKYNPDAEYYTTLTFTRSDGEQFEITRNVDVWRPDGSGWNTVLLKIPESDYTTQVTAQSFIQLNETTRYQTELVTVSIAQTAATVMSYGATSEYVAQYVENIVTGVTLNQTSATLQEGKTLQLTATTTPSGYSTKFTTSDKSVASVDVNGKVQAKGVGTATITAEINGYTATCQVTVTAGATTVSAFTSSLKPSGLSDKTTDITTWLNNVFADERVGAVTFDTKSDKADTALSTSPSMISVSFSANQTVSLSITRAMYEKWQASGNTKFIIKAQHDGGWISSATVSFTNFQLVFMQEFEESQALTASEVEVLNGYMPDYSDNSYTFDFLGYTALGSYSGHNGEQVEGKEDYRNLYRVEEYKDAGMTILYLQSAACIPNGVGSDSFNFATSKMKAVMDMALQANMTKVVACDYRIVALTNATESLIGEGGQFATQEDLDAQIKKWMAPYATHGAFYGVQLRDEPSYTQLTALGQVYRSIKRVYPNAYVHCNLFPCTEDAVTNGVMAEPSAELVAKYTDLGYGANATILAGWEGYLTAFLDATGADYIMYDKYPLNVSGANELYLAAMQVSANVAKERGVAFKFVSQSYTGTTTPRVLTEEDLRWLNNMQLGFGIDQLGYFTYFTRDGFLDGASFITSDGEKTDLYYAMRKIMAENQEFASTILSFDYQASATYTAHTAYSNNLANYCADNAFAKLQNVFVNQENALVSELYDKTSDKYMYMVQNLVDPFGGSVKATQTVKLTFNENYKYAIVWKNGKQSVVKLENNEYVVTQNAGEAVYVIPFNPTENTNGGFVFDKAQGDNGIWFFDEENWK